MGMKQKIKSWQSSEFGSRIVTSINTYRTNFELFWISSVALQLQRDPAFKKVHFKKMRH